jgi:hypothetical protein
LDILLVVGDDGSFSEFGFFGGFLVKLCSKFLDRKSAPEKSVAKELDLPCSLDLCPSCSA